MDLSKNFNEMTLKEKQHYKALTGKDAHTKPYRYIHKDRPKEQSEYGGRLKIAKNINSNCKRCDGEFMTNRKDRLYCTPRCRMADYHDRQKFSTT